MASQSGTGIPQGDGDVVRMIQPVRQHVRIWGFRQSTVGTKKKKQKSKKRRSIFTLVFCMRGRMSESDNSLRVSNPAHSSHLLPAHSFINHHDYISPQHIYFSSLSIITCIIHQTHTNNNPQQTCFIPDPIGLACVRPQRHIPNVFDRELT